MGNRSAQSLRARVRLLSCVGGLTLVVSGCFDGRLTLYSGAYEDIRLCRVRQAAWFSGSSHDVIAAKVLCGWEEKLSLDELERTRFGYGLCEFHVVMRVPHGDKASSSCSLPGQAEALAWAEPWNRQVLIDAVAVRSQRKTHRLIFDLTASFKDGQEMEELELSGVSAIQSGEHVLAFLSGERCAGSDVAQTWKVEILREMGRQ